MHDVADLILFFMLLSLGLQLLCTVGIYFKNFRQLLIEILGTLSFTKPGFNKYRVLTNAKASNDSVISPVTEMVMFKVAEMIGGGYESMRAITR